MDDDQVVNTSHLVGENGDHGYFQTPPPSKKARYIFQKVFNKTFVPNNMQGAANVLAPDSDEEMS